uniref:ATP synthase F0 subunit 8 n=1 Tax=Xenogryllus marmoratus TaxID=323499 RepID=A0A411LWL1_9ORTH|nr:ATP synthase F0 subunit 8 [Xenogryllus marmoratus]QBF03780.1 ATP synthase F0 subunit 8 [Xenogryllus marmoratus]
MPQMAPMNWLLLSITFIMLFMLMMMMNYFTTQPTIHNNPSNSNYMINSLNWKW